MLPANPPFPTPWYFPFHPLPGNQTSIFMSESLAGLSSMMTRQKAGRSLIAGAPGMPPGASNPPAATDCADVMVVSGSFRLLRLSHDAAKAEELSATAVAVISNNSNILVNIRPRLAMPHSRIQTPPEDQLPDCKSEPS